MGLAFVERDYNPILTIGKQYKIYNKGQNGWVKYVDDGYMDSITSSSSYINNYEEHLKYQYFTNRWIITPDITQATILTWKTDYTDWISGVESYGNDPTKYFTKFFMEGNEKSSTHQFAASGDVNITIGWIDYWNGSRDEFWIDVASENNHGQVGAIQSKLTVGTGNQGQHTEDNFRFKFIEQ